MEFDSDETSFLTGSVGRLHDDLSRHLRDADLWGSEDLLDRLLLAQGEAEDLSSRAYAAAGVNSWSGLPPDADQEMAALYGLGANYEEWAIQIGEVLEDLDSIWEEQIRPLVQRAIDYPSTVGLIGEGQSVSVDS